MSAKILLLVFCIIISLSASQATITNCNLGQIVNQTAVDETCAGATQYRPIDGSCNNLANPCWGTANYPLLRATVPAYYPDGFHAPTRQDSWIAGAREISNVILARPHVFGTRQVSDMHTFMGQLIIADITNTQRGSQPMPIPVPKGDLYFDATATGNMTMSFTRSAFINVTQHDGSVIAEQINTCTAWLDMSWLYGVSTAPPLASAGIMSLRSFVDGKLNNSLWVTANQLFFNKAPFIFGPWWTTFPMLKVRGDSRTNKTPEMVALSEIFGMEHNRLCDQFKIANPTWDDETLFQTARKWNIAQWQKIVTREWLATLMGVPLAPYFGYNATMNPGVDNFYTAAAHRYGHGEVNSVIYRVDNNLQEIPEGDLLMRNAFWHTQTIIDVGIEYVLLGASLGPQGYVTAAIIDDIRNYMFVSPPYSSDLGATNIQRGRDHGLPSYTEACAYLNLTVYESWEEFTNDTELIGYLEKLYVNISSMDPWIGGLLEPKLPESNLGPLFQTVITNQFTRLRDGDRFWYENPEWFTPDELATIYNTTLADIIMRNSNATNLPTDVFWQSQRQLPAASSAASSQILWPFAGEYENFVDLSASYRVSWTYDPNADVIHYMIQTFASGWAGLGFKTIADPEPFTMKTGDIFLCRNPNGTYIFMDAYALDVGPPTSDTSLPGGTYDIYNTSGQFLNGITTCRWTKPRVTKDQWDHPIIVGATPIIFAFQPTSNELVYHGPTRSATATLNVLSCIGSACNTGSSTSNTGTIIGAVLGSVLGVMALALVGLVGLVIALLFWRRKKKEKEVILAEAWSETDEDESAEEEENGNGKGSLISRALSVADLAGMQITVEPKDLTFGLAAQSKCPVDEKVTDTIHLTNTGRSRKFTFYVPTDPDRFTCALYPGTGVLKMGETLDITVDFTLLMTTNVDRKIKLDIEGVGIHLISINLVGELSTKLDPDDIMVIPPPLGSGSFGTVYKASYRGSEVAAKMLNHQMDVRQIAEFKKEVDVMMRLRSQHILHFVGASFVPGKICLVSEYCPKGSLSNFIFSSKPFNYLLKLKVASDMAKAISFLHTNGIMHRDIKPDNFLIITISSKAPVSVKLADFGTSRSITKQYEPFNHTAALGTPLYMAPEILEHKSYSVKVDTFSFGVVLWTLYTRSEPWTELKRQWDIPRNVIKGKRPAIPDDCPENFAELIQDCWAQDPDARPEMAEVAKRLEEMFEAELKLNRKYKEDDKGGEKGPSGRAATADPSRSTPVSVGQMASTWEAGQRGDLKEQLDKAGSSSESSEDESSDEDDGGKGKEKEPQEDSDEDLEKGKDKKKDKKKDNNKGKERKDERARTGGY
jgi:peroxidase